MRSHCIYVFNIISCLRLFLFFIFFYYLFFNSKKARGAMRMKFYLGIIIVQCLLGIDGKEDFNRIDKFLHDQQTRHKLDGYGLILMGLDHIWVDLLNPFMKLYIYIFI
jgi:hypothetical protein